MPTKQFDVSSILSAREAAFGGPRAEELLRVIARRTQMAQSLQNEKQRAISATANIFSLLPEDSFQKLKGNLTSKFGEGLFKSPAEISRGVGRRQPDNQSFFGEDSSRGVGNRQNDNQSFFESTLINPFDFGGR